MFKNLIIYRLTTEQKPNLSNWESALQARRFVECSASQEKSFGFVEPRNEENGVLVESINGQWILKFVLETKSVPASVLKRQAKQRAKEIEKQTGRKIGKKEMRDLQEQLKYSLLAMTFGKQTSLWLWFDPQTQLLCVDASSQARADEVITALTQSISGLNLVLLDTQTSPQIAMAKWLVTHEAPEEFAIEYECELKANDESKTAIRYAHHVLDTDEIRQHVEQGKYPTRLALSWDDRVTFTLTQGLQLKKISYPETAFEEDSQAPLADRGFDADLALITGELSLLLPDLIRALDGEPVQ